MIKKTNPIIYSDFPDPDIIRIEDTYYMISTTMHFTPGASILRSYDLANWELVGHVYDTLDDTPGQKLEGNSAYGQMMWAPTFRYNNGTFYLIFAANDTKKTYLFTTDDPEGTWSKSYIEGFYHDSSLLFDDDGRVYLAYGNYEIHLIELAKDLSGPKPGGLNRTIVVEDGDVRLGYEGAHLQKHNGKYYLFLINWPSGEGRRSEWCFIADSLEGEFVGRKIINDDLGFFNNGVAQGGMIDTPEGDWYLFMFQDRGAVGRIPILIPMEFDEDYPVIKNATIPLELSVKSIRPEYIYQPLNGSDDFNYQPEEKLKNFWQFNHQQNPELWSIIKREDEKAFRVKTDKVVPNLTLAQNTLTQRTVGPKSSAMVTVDGSGMNIGDVAGLCILQGSYGAIALKKQADAYCLVMMNRPGDYNGHMGGVWDESAPIVHEEIKIIKPVVRLKVEVDFTDLADKARFYYLENNLWQPLGEVHQLYFKLDHFVGARFGLFMYSTKKVSGHVNFLHFKYEK